MRRASFTLAKRQSRQVCLQMRDFPAFQREFQQITVSGLKELLFRLAGVSKASRRDKKGVKGKAEGKNTRAPLL